MFLLYINEKALSILFSKNAGVNITMYNKKTKYINIHIMKKSILLLKNQATGRNIRKLAAVRGKNESYKKGFDWCANAEE